MKETLHLLHFETKQQPLLKRARFIRRMALNISFSALLIGISLVAGMLGYHYLESMAWIDAFANASMILSGMGPLDPLHTFGGKLFAGCYALYSGLLLVLITGLILAPIFHRVLHRFHLEVKE